MFFVAGVSSKQKKLDFNQTVICPQCGKYGRYEVIMEYMNLSLFFISTLKWYRRYYVESSCCGSTYSINNDIGSRIARGEPITLTQQDLQLIYRGRNGLEKQCPACGFETQEDFKYCPRCASPLK
jgi:hypothetical protein